jgi:hypothetical protein
LLGWRHDGFARSVFINQSPQKKSRGAIIGRRV